MASRSAPGPSSSALVGEAPRGDRRRRPRRPSRHAGVPGRLALPLACGVGRELDLVASDDATSEVYSAFLVEEESTHSSFRGLQETIEAKGLFCSFYTDRGSHYFVTPKAGGPRRRSGGRSSSSTSPPIRHRPGGGSSGSSARSRTVCRKSSDWPGSATSRRPTATSARSARGSGRKPRSIPERPWPRATVKVRVHEYPDGTLAVFHGPAAPGPRRRPADLPSSRSITATKRSVGTTRHAV